MNTSQFKLNLAVVIGINNYENGIPTLGTARQDAEAIAHLLETEYHFQVHLITDTTETQATSQNLKTWLETKLPEIMKTANPSRLLFYFAGHGIALNGDEGPQGYLILHNAKLGDVSTYLPMQQVEAALAQLPCRHCLIILDCCFAGAFRWSSTRHLAPINRIIHKERFDRFIQDPAWQVITSAASDQYALDSLDIRDDRGIAKDNSQHSPFAAALLAALSGSADAFPPATNGKPAGDGIITATELYLYLRDSVETPTEANNQRQTPQIWCLKKHDKGEFIFLPPGHQLNLPPAPSLDELEDNNPYRGLKSYETKDSGLFFGRTALINKLCDAISDRPFTVVLGASGSGKSSLVKAGLIAHLNSFNQNEQTQKPQQHFHECKYAGWKALTPIRPGESPIKSLNNVLKELGALTTSLATGQIDSRIFTDAIAVWSQAHPNTRLLLTIDQFEELTTLCRSDIDKQQFLAILADLVKAHPDLLRLVVTLRSDFEPQFRSTPLEHLWQDARFVVPAMNREELRMVIEEPASTKVVYFESLDNLGYLVDQLIDEVAGMPGALSLLSFALSQLYQKLARRYLEAEKTGDTVERSITWTDYDELGGVTKSLTCRADEVYDRLVKIDHVYALTIRHVMLRMVSIGGELSRRQVPIAELSYPQPENNRVEEVINQFSTARLLVSGIDSSGNSYIEPAHDVLVRGWEKLRVWKTQEEENLILQRRLTPAAVEWDSIRNQEKDRKPGILDKANPVLNWLDRGFFTLENFVTNIPAQFVRFLRRSQNARKRSREKPAEFLWDTNPYLRLLDRQFHADDNWLNQVEREFIRESVLEKRRKTSWQWRIAIGVILGLSGLTITALYQLNQAQRQRVEQLAANSEVLLAGNQPVNAVINAIAATGLSQSVLVRLLNHSQFRSVEASLLDVVRVNREQNHLFHLDVIHSVAFSPDGSQIVSGSNDGMVRVWDAKKGVLIGKPFQGHLGSVSSVSFSSDGKQIVSGSSDKTVRIWDAKKGVLIGKPIQSQDGAILSMALSQNGHRIVIGTSDSQSRDRVGSRDRTMVIRVLDAKTGALIGKSYQGFYDEVPSIALSPDGTNVAIGSGISDMKVEVLDVNAGTLIGKPFQGHLGSVSSVSFSPDGKRIVSGGSDKTIRIWDVRTGTSIGEPFQGHNGTIYSVSFSPDGKRIVSGGSDKTIRIWDVNTGTSVGEPFQGHNGAIYSVSFSPDGKQIISGSGDKTIRIWDLSTGNLSIKPFQGHSNVVSSVAFSPDGKRILSGSWDKTVRLWDASTGNPIGKPFQGHNGAVSSVAFSLDGKRIISGSFDKTVRLWDASTGILIGKPLQGYDSVVSSVAFSPGERRVDDDGAVYSVAFSKDGKYIISGSWDGAIRFWDISWEFLLPIACNQLRYHPSRNEPITDVSREAKQICEHYIHYQN